MRLADTHAQLASMTQTLAEKEKQLADTQIVLLSQHRVTFEPAFELELYNDCSKVSIGISSFLCAHGSCIELAPYDIPYHIVSKS